MDNEKRSRRRQKTGRFSRLMFGINKVVEVLTPPPLIMVIIIVVIILANITSLVIVLPKITSAQKNTTQLINSNNDLGLKNEGLLTQIETIDSVYLGSILLKAVPPDTLTQIAQKSWKYSLTLNGKKLDPTIQNDAQSSEIDIVLTEQRASSDLPDAVAVLGKVNSVDGLQSLNEAITATATIAKCKIITSTTLNNQTNVDYTFSNVTAGEIVTLQLSPNLKKQLGINKDSIEIFNSKIVK